MRFNICLAVTILPSLAFAFPGMASRDDILEQLKQQKREEAEHVEKRQLLSAITAAIGTATGLLGSVASSVDRSNLRPEPGYTFQAPGPNDSRGPCPGLNLLANYGYLPRNGYVNFGQVLNATARGFNMATDLSSILATFAVLTDGDIATESWYLGTGPGNVGGLNRHSTVEADVSPNREDYYLGCGDNHHLSSRLFRQNVLYAAASSSKQFDLNVMGSQWVANAKFSQKNNPYIYFFPFPSIVALGAYPFYPNFFSNGTYRAGGVANYESISSIMGAKYNPSTGQFSYVPERWPKNWYRRATPYGAVQLLTDVFTSIYPRYPLPMAFAQLGSDNLNANTVLCDIYQGLQSITPVALAGQEEKVAAGLTWAAAKLTPLIAPSVLGCPTSALSNNFLYSNSSQTGGPLSPPASVASNAGNNAYSKVYFKTAPSSPACSHSFAS